MLDLGLHRRMDHDASKGIASLATKWISRAAATQRSGRAGRTQPGLCLRFYTRQWRPRADVKSLLRLLSLYVHRV